MRPNGGFVLVAGAVLLFGVAVVFARGLGGAGAGGARVGAGTGAAGSGAGTGAGAAGEGAGARGAGVAPGADVAAPAATGLPDGYVWAVPADSTVVVSSGVTCYDVNGVRYCPVFYEGSTAYRVSP